MDLSEQELEAINHSTQQVETNKQNTDVVFLHFLNNKPKKTFLSTILSLFLPVSSRGNSWESVAGCEHVVDTLLCNMTGAFPDRSEIYFCKVQAVLGQQVSPEAITDGFKPILDSECTNGTINADEKKPPQFMCFCILVG